MPAARVNQQSVKPRVTGQAAALPLPSPSPPPPSPSFLPPSFLSASHMTAHVGQWCTSRASRLANAASCVSVLEGGAPVPCMLHWTAADSLPGLLASGSHAPTIAGCGPHARVCSITKSVHGPVPSQCTAVLYFSAPHVWLHVVQLHPTYLLPPPPLLSPGEIGGSA